MRTAFALSGAGYGSYDGKGHGGYLGGAGHKFDGFGKSYGGKKVRSGGFGLHGIAKRTGFGKKAHDLSNRNQGVFTSGFGGGRYGRPDNKKVKYGGPISGKPQANLSFNRHSSKKSNPYGSLGGW